MANRIVLDGNGGFKTLGAARLETDNEELGDSKPATTAAYALAAHARFIEEKKVNNVATTSTNPRILSGVPSVSISSAKFVDKEVGVKKREKKEKIKEEKKPGKVGRPKNPLNETRFFELARKKGNISTMTDVVIDDEGYMVEACEIHDASGKLLAYSTLVGFTVNYHWA